jgi:hypothetical protein
MPPTPAYLWPLTPHQRAALLFILTEAMAPSPVSVEVHIDPTTGEEVTPGELFTQLMTLEPIITEER